MLSKEFKILMKFETYQINETLNLIQTLSGVYNILSTCFISTIVSTYVMQVD